MLINTLSTYSLAYLLEQSVNDFAQRMLALQWEFAVCLRKLKQGLCINIEGWDGERDGRGVQKEKDICIPMADSVRVVSGLPREPAEAVAFRLGHIPLAEVVG